MSLKSRQSLTVLAGILAVTSFLIISSFAVVWANGLRFNPTTGSFEQTVLIAIDGPDQTADVLLNGEKVSSEIPYRIRNLLPDHYTVSLVKNGFQTWQQSFWLSVGQVGLITNPTLIAKEPLVSTADSQLVTKLMDPLDFGLSLESGELKDKGVLITRFGNTPVQVHRYNDYYLYQVDGDLRVFIPQGTQDYLIYRATAPGQLSLILYPNNWQVAVSDGSTTKLVNLTIPGTSGP